MVQRDRLSGRAVRHDALCFLQPAFALSYTAEFQLVTAFFRGGFRAPGTPLAIARLAVQMV